MAVRPAKTARSERAPSPGLLSPIEGPVMGAANAIPIKQVQAWFGVYFRPVETYLSNKKSANLTGILFHLVLIGLVAWLVAEASSLLAGKSAEAMLLVPGIALYPIMVIIATFIVSAIYFAVAKLLGGKAGFMEQTLALALLYGAGMGMGAPFNALAGLPVIGALFGLVALAVSLYNIYNYYVLIKAIHQLSTPRAIAVIAIPFLIVIGLISGLAIYALSNGIA